MSIGNSCLYICLNVLYLLQDGTEKALISFKSTVPFHECYVNIEDVSIKCSSIFEAVAVVISATYLFNLKYPNGLQETFNFIEVAILDFTHDQKLSKRAQSLIKTICATK